MTFAEAVSEVDRHLEECNRCSEAAGSDWCEVGLELLGKCADTGQRELENGELRPGRLFGIPVIVKRIERVDINEFYFGHCDDMKGFGTCKGHWTILSLNDAPPLGGYMMASIEATDLSSFERYQGEVQRRLFGDLSEAHQAMAALRAHCRAHGRYRLWRGPVHSEGAVSHL